MKRKVLVTGGTRGIGEAIAKAFLQSGHSVIVTGTRPEGQGPVGTTYLACDFTDEKQVLSLLAQIKGLAIDILINNAGINKIGPAVDYDPSDFDRIFQVNVKAPFRLCQTVVPGMRERRFGRIVTITSVFGVVSRAGRSAYSASKFGLFGMSRALALEVAKDNVLINCVAPGFIDTDLSRQILGEAGIAEIEKRIPMGRLGTPIEVAECVKFLAGDANTYLTGQQIVVDGGFTCE